MCVCVCVCVCNHCCRGVSVSITYNEYVFVALGIHHLWPVQLYSIFPHYLINNTFKKKKVIQCAFWFPLQLLSGTFLSLRRSDQDMIKSVYWSPYNVPILLVSFLCHLDFRNIFWKIIKYYISGKSIQWEPSCSMWMDRQIISLWSSRKMLLPD